MKGKGHKGRVGTEHVNAHVRTCMHARTCTCTCVHAHARVHTRVCTRMCTHARAHMHVHVSTCVHTCVTCMLLRFTHISDATVPKVTAISPCLKSLLSEVPNKTSTTGPMPFAFTRVVVGISGTIDVTPLQDAFTLFLGARHFHEELERYFLCIFSDFRSWFGHSTETAFPRRLGQRLC